MDFTNTLRKGMWVVHAEGVAIIHALTVAATEIHFVDAAGETIGRAIVAPATLRQARAAEIPAARRPAVATSARFGYL